VTGYRSARQRRDTNRRRRHQHQEQQLAEFREQIAATRPVTPAGLLAQEFGVDVAPWRLRDGDGVRAAWPGGCLVGPLDTVRAELERKLPRLQPAP
jgi:hypothetical protein